MNTPSVRIYTYLLAFSLAIFFCSCGGGTSSSDELDEIENMSDSISEEILQEVNSVDTTEKIEHWDAYWCYLDNHYIWIFLNMDLVTEAPLEGKYSRLTVEVTLSDTTKEGLPAGDFRKELNAFSDSLETDIEFYHDALYVGCATHYGRRFYYYYLSNPVGHNETIDGVLAEFKNIKATYRIVEDRDWETYFRYLYPDEYEKLSMDNYNQLKQLLKDSIDLRKPVEVWYHFYFAEKGNNSCIKAAEKLGLSVTHMDKRNDLYEDYPYHVIFAQKRKITNASLDDLITELKNNIEEGTGIYDSWEPAPQKGD